MIQQYGGIVAEGPFSATSTGGLVTARAASSIGTLPSSIWGYSITNCDAAATLYLAYRTPTSSVFHRSLAPGQTWEVSADVGDLNRLQILSSAASTPAYIVIRR